MSSNKIKAVLACILGALIIAAIIILPSIINPKTSEASVPSTSQYENEQ